MALYSTTNSTFIILPKRHVDNLPSFLSQFHYNTTVTAFLRSIINTIVIKTNSSHSYIQPNRNYTSPFYFNLLLLSASMANPESAPVQPSEKNVYSVWALPPEDVTARIKNLMNSLRSDFGGPQFEPHITLVGAIRLTPDDALNKFRSACQGLKAYQVTVDNVSTGTFFFQCVFLLIHPTTEVLETSVRCCERFGYKYSTPYMPHMSLLYANISEEKKKQAKEIADKLDEAVNGLKFPITRVVLYKTDTEDETLKSWEKIAEHELPSS